MQKNPLRLPHGSPRLPAVTIASYSLELREGKGFVGDRASRTAFREGLDRWRKLYRRLLAEDVLGEAPTEDFGKRTIDTWLREEGDAAAVILSAMEDHAAQLARVVRRFARHASWQGVQRVAIGGGFKQSLAGRYTIRRADQLLRDAKVEIRLRAMHHHSDEGGLIGWVHAVPPALWRHYDGMLAVDIGGTNVRCGIVRVPGESGRKPRDPDAARVGSLRKWGHAEDKETTHREHLVQGIADMLTRLIDKADRKGLNLAPLVGVACPGHIHGEGLITSGAQNLPGDWEHENFNLPQKLMEVLPSINGIPPHVRLHNDAVVQGLSELPWMRDVSRWAVLTIGTGLGNASYVNGEDRDD
ncbi:ROK family protein [Achromobacter aloeverae]|uniref:Glucokinase n=1 Tax=Achromobacter aloeverae TaxID=1750518 RepID=A0A4Q1HEZ7_9BURK|nr:ROK family protein [Achromobacter aloeverae]RXN85190.1 glucokinase [Achromobacter aloeverae]